MIKTNKGIVAMSGNLQMILADLSMIVDALKKKDANLKEILQAIVEDIWDNDEGILGQKTKKAIEKYNNNIHEEQESEEDKKIDKQIDELAEKMAELLINNLFENEKEETEDENN